MFDFLRAKIFTRNTEKCFANRMRGRYDHDYRSGDTVTIDDNEKLFKDPLPEDNKKKENWETFSDWEKQANANDPAYTHNETVEEMAQRLMKEKVAELHKRAAGGHMTLKEAYEKSRKKKLSDAKDIVDMHKNESYKNFFENETTPEQAAEYINYGSFTIKDKPTVEVKPGPYKKIKSTILDDTTTDPENYLFDKRYQDYEFIRIMESLLSRRVRRSHTRFLGKHIEFVTFYGTMDGNITFMHGVVNGRSVAMKTRNDIFR